MDETFPPWQTARAVILLNVLIILNCLFYHCLSEWREMGCQEHIPVVIQTACLASKSAHFPCPWTEICSSTAIFAKSFLAKQNNSANKKKEESGTRKTRDSPVRFLHTVISVGTPVGSPADLFNSQLWIASTPLGPSQVSRFPSKKRTCKLPAISTSWM